MLVIPAIDLKGGKCVRLRQGDYSTAAQVAEDAVKTALSFQRAGAQWLHVVDLDGAKSTKPENAAIILEICRASEMKIEVGGGIRSMDTVEYYLRNGISRVILGTAAVQSPEFVRQAVGAFGGGVAVGIDARNGMVSQNGWTEDSSVDYLTLAKKMEEVGVKNIIFTDIARDGMQTGPNLEMLRRLNREVSCDITASGGISGLKDISDLVGLGLYGAICGKSLYSGSLDLKAALHLCGSGRKIRMQGEPSQLAERFFNKAELVPAVVQEHGTGEVLMLAYMNRDSLKLTLETGYTWFYSRSRQQLWNKGATSGHLQQVVAIRGDCDDDTLLITVKQTGAACHTGNHSCFFNEIWRDAADE